MELSALQRSRSVGADCRAPGVDHIAVVAAVCRQRHQRLIWVLVPSSTVASIETRRIARPSDRSPRLRPHAIDPELPLVQTR